MDGLSAQAGELQHWQAVSPQNVGGQSGEKRRTGPVSSPQCRKKAVKVTSTLGKSRCTRIWYCHTSMFKPQLKCWLLIGLFHACEMRSMWSPAAVPCLVLSLVALTWSPPKVVNTMLVLSMAWVMACRSGPAVGSELLRAASVQYRLLGGAAAC